MTAEPPTDLVGGEPVPATGPALPTVLLVDDDPAVLAGLRRTLRAVARTLTATSGSDALRLLAEHPDEVAVVVSDLRMPGLDGTALFAELAPRHPEIVRVMLSGHADLTAALDAIRLARVFRLLLKPADPDDVVATVRDALEQHRLLRVERELLDTTLRASIETLTEVLALSDPLVFSRMVRLRRLVRALGDAVGVRRTWELEVAAALSLVGASSLPEQTSLRLHEGRPLDRDERAAVARLAPLADALLAPIPRLERVRRIIVLGAAADPTGAATPDDPPDVELAATILCVAAALDQQLARGRTAAEAAHELASRLTGRVARAVLGAASTLPPSGWSSGQPKDVRIDRLADGMVLAGDLRSDAGQLLLGRGQPVTATVLAHLRHHTSTLRPDHLVPVEVPDERCVPRRLAPFLAS